MYDDEIEQFSDTEQFLKEVVIEQVCPNHRKQHDAINEVAPMRGLTGWTVQEGAGSAMPGEPAEF